MDVNLRTLRAQGLALVLGVLLVVLAGCGSDTSQADTNFTIGLVTNNPNGMRNVQGFTDAMAQLAFDDNVSYLFANEPRSGDDLDEELEGFVAAGVDLIFTAGTPTGTAAYRITDGTGIPVVFGVIADPVAAGVLDDLNRPGGNMTGVQLGPNEERRLELLVEIVPTIKTVFVPFNPGDSAAVAAVAQISAVADDLGVELVLTEANNHDEVIAAFEMIPETTDAIFLVPDSTVNANLPFILEVATALVLPTSGPSTAQVEEGAMMTYGFVHEQAGAQAARIAHQVLHGADPGVLPIEDTESFLGINLVTADLIGVEISDAVLQRADIIIRADSNG